MNFRTNGGDVRLFLARGASNERSHLVYLYLSLKSPGGITDDKLSLGPISLEAN